MWMVILPVLLAKCSLSYSELCCLLLSHTHYSHEEMYTRLTSLLVMWGIVISASMTKTLADLKVVFQNDYRRAIKRSNKIKIFIVIVTVPV